MQKELGSGSELVDMDVRTAGSSKWKQRTSMAEAQVENYKDE